MLLEVGKIENEKEIEIKKNENEEIIVEEDSTEDKESEAELAEPAEPEVEEGQEETEEEGIVEIPDVPIEEEEQLQFITLVETPKGNISVIHDITFGDLLISTILMAHLIFIVLYKMIRRH